MPVPQVFHLLFSISSCFFFINIQSRHHSRTELEQFHVESHVSVPPSPAPEAAAASPSYNTKSPNNPSSVFNVLDFGAIGDGVTDDTQAFKLAWDMACQNESAVLLVPDGHSFMLQSTIFTGPCKTAVLLFQIDGTIMPPDGPDCWPRNSSKRQWLVFYRINGMAMQGGGLIDGRGEKWWSLPCKPHKGNNGKTMPGPCDTPVANKKKTSFFLSFSEVLSLGLLMQAIRFFMSSNLTVKELKIKNSPKFNFRFDACHDVRIESLTIKAPAQSPNTDGIHIENTNNVQIYNSIISNGDDCVSIGAGCYNVNIKNITCGPSHGISIGSLGIHNSRACVSNVSVSDSVIKHSDNGVRIKTWQGGSGCVSKVKFSNIRVDAVRNPIIIDQYYCLTRNCRNQTSAVVINDISYSNIKGSYDVRSPPMRFACSDSIPCTNLTLAQVELLPAQGQIVANPFCWNAYGNVLTETIPPVYCLMEEMPQVITHNYEDSC
ncbi:polygalacturonase At1g48100-like [Durio zibethinus]|uniref:endo-polygalacturonase n=1 Tax=Durio zibethinus TaxID=66656 RepID=A0A6P5WWZ8_DURZI|nr:polygalacturonase At1g48100-like [Durio zibethinus]